MPRLNKQQRLLLSVGAVCIGLLLAVQIANVGLEDSNWLPASLVIVALLLFAAAGNAEVTPDTKRSNEAAPTAQEDGLSPVIDAALRDAKEQFTKQFKLLFDKKAAPPGIKIDMGLPIGPTTDPTAWKAAFMIVLLSLAKRHRGFEDSAEASKLVATTAVEIASSTNRMRAALEGRTWSLNQLKPEEMQPYLKEVVECRFRVMRTMRQLAQNTDHPLDAIFSLLSKEFPFGGSTPEDREQAYGAVARNIMRDLTR